MSRIIVISFWLLCSASEVFAQNDSNKPAANFSIDSSRSPIFCFEYKPQLSTSYRWGFYHKTEIVKGKQPFVRNEKLESKDTQFCVDYRDSQSVYWVCLEATKATGKKDTVCKRLSNRFEAVLVPPNVFTPDSKDSNAVTIFKLEYKNLKPPVASIKFLIFDRWGAKVFETTDVDAGWNGKVNNIGNACPDGTYFYILKYRLMGEDKEEPPVNGTITIIR